MVPAFSNSPIRSTAEQPDTVSEVAAEAKAPASAGIARLAYNKYSARNFADGHHLDDWNAAEAELRALARL